MSDKSKNSQKTVCIMIGDVSYEFSVELMKGYFDSAAREGVRLLLLMGMLRHSGHFASESEQEMLYYNSIYDYAGLSGADAYVFSCGALSGFESENTYQEFLKRFAGTPYVILQEQVDTQMPWTSCITIDNYSSFSYCIEHLIQVHSCRKIGFVGGLQEHPDTKKRLEAYRDTMQKHGLPVPESLIVFGDYSEYSDSHVAWLLDHNPGLEAIAFCNDEMAKGGYRECARRGLQVGKDIAITGFDNFATSRFLVPPLTTVSQNTYQMGGMAVRQVVALMQKQGSSCVKLDTKFHIRQSCGCNPDMVHKLFTHDTPGGKEAGDHTIESQKLRRMMQRITEDLVNAFPRSERMKSHKSVKPLTDQFLAICQGEPDTLFDRSAFARWLQTYCDAHAPATTILAKRLNDYIMQMPKDCLTQSSMRLLYNIISFAQGYLFSFKARAAERNLDDFRAQSWFIPELIRDLVGYDIENESVFLTVVERLRNINLNSIYICLLPQAHPLHSETKEMNMPEKLLLAAYHSGDKARAYPHAEMPIINAQHALIQLPDLKKETHLMCFSIFSGNVQYGILLCEADIPKTPLLHIVGLQLGILINFLDLKRKEKIVGNELENIRERNEILNFLNEYDSQCAILNRRGFIERAIRLNRENVGKHAICVFMDLDHLKEINDTFGHSQGDVALSAVSDILKQTVRGNDLVARIGGDEFVGMFIIDTPAYDKVFRNRLTKAFETYNRSSGLAYYVEASVGIAHFTCNQGLEISKIVNDADRYLYEAKKHKRKSALKEQN